MIYKGSLIYWLVECVGDKSFGIEDKLKNNLFFIFWRVSVSENMMEIKKKIGKDKLSSLFIPLIL